MQYMRMHVRHKFLWVHQAETACFEVCAATAVAAKRVEPTAVSDQWENECVASYCVHLRRSVVQG